MSMPYATQLLYSDSCLMLLSPICLRFHLIHDLWAAFLFDLIDVKPEVILRMGLSKSVYLLSSKTSEIFWLKCDCCIKMDALCLFMNGWLVNLWTVWLLIGKWFTECCMGNCRRGWGVSWFLDKLVTSSSDSLKLIKSPDRSTDSV